MKPKFVRERRTSFRWRKTSNIGRWVSALYLGIVCCGILKPERCHGGDVDEEAMALIHAANEIHNGDWERLKHVQAEGRLEFLSADKTVFWVCRTSFEVSEGNLWMTIINETVEPPGSRSYQEVELVADGQTIAATNRSERIKPAGCETEICKDDITGFQIRTGCHEIDPRKTIVPFFLRGDTVSGYTKRDVSVRFQQGNSGGTARQVEVLDSNTVQRFVFSSDHSNRLTEYSLAMLNEDPTWLYRYTYDAKDDAVFPRSITVEIMDLAKHKGRHSCKLQVEKIVPKASGLPFNLSRLQICENSRVLDHRADAATAVRNSSPSAIDSVSAAPIDAQVVALPDRYQIPDRQPLRQEQKGWPWQLIAFNASVVIGVVAYLWTKRRRTP